MWRNHLKIATRLLFKNKLTSSINIAGLGLGLMVAILVLLYLRHELSYDQWIADKENIYRIYRQWEKGANLYTPGPLAEALRTEVPGVATASRVAMSYDMLLEWNESYHKAPIMYSVDSTFFQTIPWEFKYGDPSTAFKQLDGAVLTEDLAEQIFGDRNPVGETLLMETTHLLTVKGVLKTPETPSHLEADLFLFEEIGSSAWTGAIGHTYVRLEKDVDPARVSATIYELAKEKIQAELQADKIAFNESDLPQWQLQAVEEVHLNSTNLGENGLNNGSFGKLSIIALLGLVTLLLAIINYINLATARIGTRADEIGVRKIIGAARQHLVSQFVFEAGIAVVLALVLSLALSYLSLPIFNYIVSRPLELTDLFNAPGIATLVGLTIFVVLAAGILPSYYFSSLNPAKTIKKEQTRDRSSISYRNALVVFQFSLSIGLVLFVSFTWNQVDFMLSKELGFQGDQIAVFRLNQSATVDNFQQKKQRLLAIPGVEAATQMSRTLGAYISNYGIELEGVEKMVYINTLFADTEWEETFEITAKSGRTLSNDFAQDTSNSFVVNQAFVDRFGLQNPIGHRMKFAGGEQFGQIVGVVDNFHYQSLENKIAPLIISANQDMAWMGRVAIRINAANIQGGIAAISDFWKELEPAFPVSYEFQDEAFAAQYESYVRYGKSLMYTSIFCVLIALLGLFGLTVFITQQRTKEIGVRKVLGASVAGIVGLLSKDYLKLVLIALVIASPISYYIGQRWLENFAYHIEIQWWVFAIAGLVAVSIAFLTVSFQSVKAALANPVEALRNE